MVAVAGGESVADLADRASLDNNEAVFEQFAGGGNACRGEHEARHVEVTFDRPGGASGSRPKKASQRDRKLLAADDGKDRCEDLRCWPRANPCRSPRPAPRHERSPRVLLARSRHRVTSALAGPG